MPSYPTSICTLDDVHDMLQIPTADTSRDATLQLYIDAATHWVSYVSDAVIPTAYTGEVHSGGKPQIVVFNTPILTVESITEYVGSYPYPLTASEAGTNLTYGYSIDNPTAGIISRRWNGFVGPFMGGENNVVVSYTAGYATIPTDIKLAVLMDIQGLWTQTQYGGNLSGDPNLGEAWTALPMNAFPRLANLLTSSRRVAAIG